MVLELRKLSEDEKIRQQAEARADYESRIATARGAGYREGKEVGLEEGIECGIERGIERGMADINGLNTWLINNHRQEEMIRSTIDKQFQDILMKEYKEAAACTKNLTL